MQGRCENTINIYELATKLAHANFVAERTARLFALGFELADHSLGLIVEAGDGLVGVLFRIVIEPGGRPRDRRFMTAPRSRPE